MIRVWIEAGVKIFRVDNPHTKPLNFWHWLIWEVKKTDPDVLFLAEAFTRPAMMHQLARIGFTQSYTYFTWRTERGELEDYGRELAANAHYMRPNFFVNTPDILHESLQFGGPPMFKIRAVLAVDDEPHLGRLLRLRAVRARRRQARAARSTSTARSTQLRPRDWAAAEASGRSLAPYLRRLNEIRRAHPALQQLRTLHFHAVDNPNLLCFSKTDPGSQRRRPRGRQPVQPPHPDRDDGAGPAGPRPGLARAVRASPTRSPARATTGASSTTWSWTPTGSPPTSSRSPCRGRCSSRRRSPDRCTLPRRPHPPTRPEGLLRSDDRSRPRLPHRPLRAAAARHRPGVVQARRLLRGPRPRLRRQQRRRRRRPARHDRQARLPAVARRRLPLAAAVLRLAAARRRLRRQRLHRGAARVRRHRGLPATSWTPPTPAACA